MSAIIPTYRTGNGMRADWLSQIAHAFGDIVRVLFAPSSTPNTIICSHSTGSYHDHACARTRTRTAENAFNQCRTGCRVPDLRSLRAQIWCALSLCVRVHVRVAMKVQRHGRTSQGIHFSSLFCCVGNMRVIFLAYFRNCVVLVPGIRYGPTKQSMDGNGYDDDKQCDAVACRRNMWLVRRRFVSRWFAHNCLYSFVVISIVFYMESVEVKRYQVKSTSVRAKCMHQY